MFEPLYREQENRYLVFIDDIAKILLMTSVGLQKEALEKNKKASLLVFFLCVLYPTFRDALCLFTLKVEREKEKSGYSIVSRYYTLTVTDVDVIYEKRAVAKLSK